MDREEDVQGIIGALEGRLLYNSVIGQTPWLHKFLLGNSMVRRATKYIPGLARLNTSRYIVDFVAEQVKRYQEKDEAAVEYKDMLDRFKRWDGDGHETMSSPELLSHAASNIFAGSDSTAISLRSMFYYLCKNPKRHASLRDEIDRMDEKGELSEIVRFSETLRMPYLQACMKEAMRLHPAVGFLLERVVPSEGVTISGQRIPGGTVVGANPWVLARDPNVYGADVDAFRPERWLDASTEALKLMDRNFLAFGIGSRTCIGRNVGWKCRSLCCKSCVITLSNWQIRTPSGNLRTTGLLSKATSAAKSNVGDGLLLVLRSTCPLAVQEALISSETRI